MSWSPARTMIAARNDLGLYSGAGRCQEFTRWQTRGQIGCSPFCASALSMWLSEGGYLFNPTEHVWGDRGDWNVTAFRTWAQRKGLWRDRNYHAKPGDGIVMRFTMLDQHIGIVAAQAAAGQPVATIEGNTSGGRVLAKTRHMPNVQGFIAFTESGQVGPDGYLPSTPAEVKEMGQVAAVIVPGAKQHKAGPLKGRWPTVDAYQHTDGTWQMRGANGVELVEENVSAYGVSVHKLGRLAKPITSIQPRTDAAGNWADDRAIVATASDFGTFTVHVKKINY